MSACAPSTLHRARLVPIKTIRYSSHVSDSSQDISIFCSHPIFPHAWNTAPLALSPHLLSKLPAEWTWPGSGGLWDLRSLITARLSLRAPLNLHGPNVGEPHWERIDTGKAAGTGAAGAVGVVCPLWRLTRSHCGRRREAVAHTKTMHLQKIINGCLYFEDREQRLTSV